MIAQRRVDVADLNGHAHAMKTSSAPVTVSPSPDSTTWLA
jgi:hypothetical protein